MSAYDNYMTAAQEARDRGDKAAAGNFLALAKQAYDPAKDGASDEPQAPAQIHGGGLGLAQDQDQGQTPGQGGSSTTPTAPVQVPAFGKQQAVDQAVNTGATPQTHFYTGAEEFAKGVPQGALSVGDMPHDFVSMADTAQAAARNWWTNAGHPSEDLSLGAGDYVPALGWADKYAKAVPVTPGYEGYREAGDTTGNFLTTEALTGGFGGAISGIRAGTKAADIALNVGKNVLTRGGKGALGTIGGGYVGEKGGDLVGMPEEGKVFGQLVGGGAPAIVENRAGVNAIKNWSEDDTVARAAAFKRLGIKPSIGAIGNDAARNEVATSISQRIPFVGGADPKESFQQQMAGLNQKSLESRDAVRGTTAPLTDTSVGATGAQAQVAASAADRAATARRDAIFGQIDPRMDTDPKLDASGTLGALNVAIKGSQGDTAKMLVKARDSLIEAANKSGWGPARAGGMRPPLTLTPDRMRKWNSDLKNIRGDDPNQGLLERELNPIVTQATADQANHFAKVGGDPRDFYAANEAARPVYDDKAVAETVLGTEPATNQARSFDQVASPKNLQNPERIASLGRQAPAETNQLKGMLIQRGFIDSKTGQVSPKTGEWWNSLPEDQRVNLTNNDPVTRQQMDDIALVSKGMKMPSNPSIFGMPGAADYVRSTLVGGATHFIPGLGGVIAPLVTGGLTMGYPALKSLLGSGGAALNAMKTGAARSTASTLAAAASSARQAQKPGQ
jgi:hypothetical protein